MGTPANLIRLIANPFFILIHFFGQGDKDFAYIVPDAQ
jgi:hypothetical protein